MASSLQKTLTWMSAHQWGAGTTQVYLISHAPKNERNATSISRPCTAEARPELPTLDSVYSGGRARSLAMSSCGGSPTIMLGAIRAESMRYSEARVRSLPIHRTKTGTPCDLSKLTRKRGHPPYERLRSVHGMVGNSSHSFQSARVTGSLHS